MCESWFLSFCRCMCLVYSHSRQWTCVTFTTSHRLVAIDVFATYTRVREDLCDHMPEHIYIYLSSREHPLIHPLCPLCADWLGWPADPAEEVDLLPQGPTGVFRPWVRAAPQRPAQCVRPAGSRRSQQRFLRRLWPRVVSDYTLNSATPEMWLWRDTFMLNLCQFKPYFGFSLTVLSICLDYIKVCIFKKNLIFNTSGTSYVQYRVYSLVCLWQH